MGLRSFVVLAVLICAGGRLTAKMGLDSSARGETTEGLDTLAVEEAMGVMAGRELNPSFYEAQRAAHVVPIYLNTRYGSPYKVFQLERVYKATVEDVGDTGRRYHLELSVKEFISDTTEKFTAEVFFPLGEKQLPPKVQVPSLEKLTTINTKAEEDALYQKYKTKTPLLSSDHLPDNFGNMDPDMKPFWYLCIVASSFIMLKESTENTFYNMAQVASLTQMPTENDQLKFDSKVLLHDMVSQEIPRWKLLFTWSPAEGVRALQMEQQPRCENC